MRSILQLFCEIRISDEVLQRLESFNRSVQLYPVVRQIYEKRLEKLGVSNVMHGRAVPLERCLSNVRIWTTAELELQLLFHAA